VRVARTQGDKRNVTIHDVATLSGVSIATVTRALQGSPLVRPATSERVLAAASQLGYRPNPNARALITGRSSTIGVLIPSLLHAYWAEVANAIEQRAGEHGYTVLLVSSHGDPAREREMLEVLHGRRVDGVIVGAVAGDPLAWPEPGPTTPVVLLDWDQTPQWKLLEQLSTGPIRPRLRRLPEEAPAGEWSAHVTADDVAGGALIARHLLALGHTRIAYLVGPPTRPYLLRLLGMRTALREAGHDLTAVVKTPDTYEGGRAVAAELLSGAEPPTALVCARDVVAVGAMKAAHALGLDVPRDVSVIGYDDIDVATYAEPPLTTLRLPMPELGKLAFDLLMQARAGASESGLHRLSGRLVERSSTGPPPGNGRAVARPRRSRAASARQR
jgi:LacI family transcriptional regulator